MALASPGMFSALDGRRVLDLTTAEGLFCGRILAEFGADVIKIEPPGGDGARIHGPSLQGLSQGERSAVWHAYNGKKRSVTLDLRKAKGRRLFIELARSADFVVESFPPGYLDRLGLGYRALVALNPGVIVVSITAFGQTGPYTHYRAGDLTATAMGGMLYPTGDPDRPPVRISADQAYLHAAAYGAMAAMLACRLRWRTGRGQHIDVSAQEAMTVPLGSINPLWEIAGEISTRLGPFVPAKMPRRYVFACRDGYVDYFVRPGQPALVEWMESEGEAPPGFRQDLEALDMQKVTEPKMRALEQAVQDFFADKTKDEIWQESRRRDLMAFPIQNLSEVLVAPHLRHRRFFGSVPLPRRGRLLAPNFMFLAPGSRLAPPAAAPEAGQHNRDVFMGELGLSSTELDGLAEAGVV